MRSCWSSGRSSAAGAGSCARRSPRRVPGRDQAAYEDASTNASARLMAAAGTSRALNLLPPEMWKRFARRANVDELAAVLADQVFDAPSPWHDAADLAEAVPEGDEQPSEEWSDADAERLAGVAEEVLSGRDAVAVEQLLSGTDWVTARR